MQFRMKNLGTLSLSEMEQLLSSGRKIAFRIEDNEQKYKLIAAVLKVQRYAKLDKRGKGIVRRFLRAVTASSRAQVTRLIARWIEDRTIVRRPAVRPHFMVRYTAVASPCLAGFPQIRSAPTSDGKCGMGSRSGIVVESTEFCRPSICESARTVLIFGPLAQRNDAHEHLGGPADSIQSERMVTRTLARNGVGGSVVRAPRGRPALGKWPRRPLEQ
jgi:hypothetical protein